MKKKLTGVALVLAAVSLMGIQPAEACTRAVSYTHLKPFCVGGFQCLNGRRRDTVCFETNQRSVYIKK